MTTSGYHPETDKGLCLSALYIGQNTEIYNYPIKHSMKLWDSSYDTRIYPKIAWFIMQKIFKQSNTWGFPFWGQAIDAPTCCRPNDLQEPQHPNDLAWDLVLRLSETWRLFGMPVRDCTTQGVCDVTGLTCWYSNMWETSQNCIHSYFLFLRLGTGSQVSTNNSWSGRANHASLDLKYVVIVQMNLESTVQSTFAFSCWDESFLSGLCWNLLVVIGAMLEAITSSAVLFPNWFREMVPATTDLETLKGWQKWRTTSDYLRYIP